MADLKKLTLRRAGNKAVCIKLIQSRENAPAINDEVQRTLQKRLVGSLDKFKEYDEKSLRC